MGLLVGLCLLLPLQAAAQETPEIGIPIVMTNDAGGKQVLELGLDPNATADNDKKFGEANRPSGPPQSEGGALTARFIDRDIGVDFGGVEMVADIRKGNSNFSGQKVHEIEFSTGPAASQVTFRWDLPAGVSGTIEDVFGGSIFSVPNITGSGSTTLTNLTITRAKITLTYNGTQKPPHRRSIQGQDGTGNDTGWRLLAPPSEAVRGDLQDDLSFDVDSGHLLHTWEGGGASAWSPATSASDPLERGEGFILYFFDDGIDEITNSGLPLDVSNMGEDQNQNVTVDGLDTNHRFHVLGNPYDVPFALNALANGNLPGNGFQQAVQVWNPQTEQFEPLMQGNAQMDPWQGFVVERTTPGEGASSVTFGAGGRQPGSGSSAGNEASNEAGPLAASGQKADGQRAVVDLALSAGGESSAAARAGATVLLDEKATAGWDGYDATRIAPPGRAVAAASLPTKRDGGVVHRVMASGPYPAEGGARSVPLSVKAAGGTATLRWPAAARGQVPDGWTVELEDKKTGTRTDLRGEAYSFEVSKSDADLSGPEDARFVLHVGPATAVPVELAGFEGAAQEDAVRLTWQTASEQNNAGFYVQRKAQADAGWERLGFVESKAPGGTTSKPQSYRFTDAKVPYAADTLSYRLRQIDTDGTPHLTDAVTLTLGAPGEVDLKPPFPNPARQQATLRFAVPEATVVQVGVYDLLGRQVATIANGRREAGRHEETLPVSSLSPGLYLVRVQAGQTVRTRKLTVVR